MPGTFLDTSAFAKLYLAELGSAEVGRTVAEADSLFVCSLVIPEALSAMRRLVREGSLDEGDYREVKVRICGDVAALDIVTISDEVIGESIAAIERSPIRTLDALHIGAALVVGASLFVTADERQAKAARESGLDVRLVT
jgi:uncharacterized protein